MKIEGQTAWVTGGGSGLGALFETPFGETIRLDGALRMAPR